MHFILDRYLFSDNKKLLQLEKIVSLLHETYWAKNRKIEIIKKSIDTSLCFGVYCNDLQIGFARCVSDYSTVYWLCDVIIDSKYRGIGLGIKLIECIVEHNELKGLMGILGTRDSKGLYSKYGFKLSTNSFMIKKSK